MKRISYSMRFFQIGLIAALCLLVVADSGMGQVPQLRLEVSYARVTRLAPADIDFDRAGGANLLFSMRIINPTASSVSVRLRGRLDVADGRPISDAASFLSNPFDANPGVTSLTNLNLSRTGTPGLDESQISDEFRPIIDDALESGQLREGVYSITLDLVNAGDPNGTPIDTKLIEFDVRNLSRVELRSPRDGETTNEFPFFEFYYEGPRAVLRIAEVGPGQSREDAMSRRPLMLESDVAGNSFLYTGGRPLENGKRYAWQLTVEQMVSGGGVNSLTSPIWEFVVGGSFGGGSESALLRQLEDIFGSRYPQIFEEIRRGGFELSGRFILNGSTISQSDVLNLINQLRQNSDSAELELK